MHKFNPLKLSVTAFLAYTLMATSWPANATWGGYGYGRHAYYGGHYYPSYRYGGHRGYGHRRYSGYYGLSRSLSYGASRDYDSSYDRSANSGVVTGAITSADGWTLLEDGETGQALQVFGAAAAQAPNEGQPKAGYAVAAALSGDYQRGVWAMRRALRIDADALHYLRLKARITGHISGLLPHYGSDCDYPNATAHHRPLRP